MQTFVLTALSGGTATTTKEAVDDGISRVEARYATLWRHAPRRDEAVSASAGMVLWESEATPSSWPAWARRRDVVVASVYAPLGHERITGSEPLESAPFILADELRASPHRMLEVAAPFVCARLSPTGDVFDLFTDAVGVGRLFEVRTETGWVWSNRPVAALLFADLPAEADPEAWAQSAVADELFGHSTPYQGVRALDPATHVHWDGRTRQRRVSVVDTCASWVPAARSSSGSIDHLLDAAAADLTNVAASVARLYSGTPVVDLTGGRDSRLVAAAFLASRTEVILHTHDGNPGDLEIARSLVSIAPHPVEHQIERVPTGGEVAPPQLRAAERARRWHDYAEGLRPCTYLSASVPAYLDGNKQVGIGGVGGEAAHGFFYPADLDALVQLPVDAQLRAFATRIVARQSRAPGASAEALAHVNDRVLALLGRISSWGVRGANILDHYYVLQRMRRWGTTGERLGTVSPLLASSFLTAALSLSPQDRRSNTLHRELTRRLLPAWAGVPYFPGETRAIARPTPPRAPRVIRLGDAEDRVELESMLADTDDWGSAFDTEEVHRLWHLSLSGGTDAYQERVLRSAVWRASFTDHLAGLSGDGARERPMANVPVPPREIPPPPVAVSSPRRVRLHPATRALARSRVWRMTRNTPAGRVVRSITRRLK